MLCQNCEQAVTYAKGRCAGCYSYFWRTGTERPPELYDRIEYCLICMMDKIHAKGRCHTCYVYFISHGRDRPNRLVDRPNICRNPTCQKPLPENERNRMGGYCRDCYNYRRRRKRNGDKSIPPNRPVEMHLGWCDCGQPATHEIKIEIGNPEYRKPSKRRYETLILCDDCRAEFDEIG